MKMFREKLAHFKKLIKFLGFFVVAKLVISRLLGTKNAERKILHPSLKHPFTLTFAGGDIAMFSEVIPRRVYELPAPLMHFVNGLPIVDIGANIGTAAVYFANLYPKSMVWSVEPHPRNFILLKTNAARYGEQITPINAAFSLSDEPVSLTNPDVAKDDRHASYMFSNTGRIKNNDVLTAESITPAGILKRLPKSRIGILKIDIEGGEKDIFVSKDINSLLKVTNILMVETHDRYFEGSGKAVHLAAERNGFLEFKERGNEHYFINRAVQ